MVTAVLLAPTMIQAQETPNPTAPSTETNSQPASGPAVVDMGQEKEENLFRSGDFSEGKAGWRGNCNVVDRNGIKVLEAKLRSSGTHTLQAVMKLDGNVTALHFQFDAEASEDLKLRTPLALKASFVQGNWITYQEVTIEAGKKKKVGFTYDVVPGTRELPLVIEIQAGSGELYLSNFRATARRGR